MSNQKENLFTPQSIRTVSGQYVNVIDPDPETIRIEDIAHALSQQCRFGGHLPFMYTVAQHCLYVCAVVESGQQLAALLHDAGEAYLVDVPRPIKEELPNYQDIENNLMRVISKKFDFEYPMPKPVKAADRKMLEIEWQQLMIDRQKENRKQIIVTSPDYSKRMFLDRFYQLTD